MGVFVLNLNKIDRKMKKNRAYVVILACYTSGRKVFDTYVVRVVTTYVVEIFMTYVVKYCYKCGIYYICGAKLLQMWGMIHMWYLLHMWLLHTSSRHSTLTMHDHVTCKTWACTLGTVNLFE